MKIWIDDVRTPPFDEDPWVWVKTSAHATLIVDGCHTYITEISFDHDLGEEDTAYIVALYIEEKAYQNKMRRIKWHIHSQNPIGVDRIRAAMQRADMYWSKHEEAVS